VATLFSKVAQLQHRLKKVFMSNFIDRRLNSKNKSTVNRQRFIRRKLKNQLRKPLINVALLTLIVAKALILLKKI
jgi:hypothetical protein